MNHLRNKFELWNHPVISSIGDIADTLKFVQDISPTGHQLRKYVSDIINLCPCLEEKYKQGSFTICRYDQLFWSGTFTDQIIEQKH